MAFDDRLERIVARSEEVQALMSSGELTGEDFTRLSQEYAELEPVVTSIQAWKSAEEQKAGAQALLDDPEMRELAQMELAEIEATLPDLQYALRLTLLPKDAADERSAILEIRPAAGGDEAGLFAAELFDAYRRFSEQNGWRFEVMEYAENEVAGLKEGMATISGRSVFARLKYESGVHRVQRVPATESQGRIHTSTVTVAVLPEAEEVDVTVNDDDLRIDVYRASGAGGQHVNKTESAVRITHMPSGIVVAMQEEKSQHKNKAKAMKILRARLYERERAQLHATRAADRKSQVGTGDRSERIRTYNFPQGRVTDHRINLTLYKIDRIMSGEFDEIIDTLTREEQTELLAAEGF
ncbi:peptide chain release factor 1 [Gluconobacter sphaericus]|uniref:Peptide chain release factor 1 n=1 Tax=Gluconobacter sphaericus NBRC 12467 TaxID=1307951 RepID=A0AA37SGP0_9PROT|nr:peptide chain release factor 1 [Gluconobacter sphaericus]MBF0885326.1 peptide chain release factor 1 [Gluconobacter sphaericus]GBR56089.1 peptide chain release factor 1 [Gluconobacter sphaericus NBRC 12467]GEB42097.1 peptide chain release factor 1 [Gluconobacter sphaericus NBRC 12467]GLQ84536.1 peptide chain release factor 1 [Gluconobacter sphaericus NBRC 12467]GLQ85310.1 peptide chain release factor 1 [Gluconobacter sphaericus NBRC 12467]